MEVDRIASGPSVTAAYLRVLNRTYRRVSVVWINYEGVCQKYKELKPYEYFDINTFNGHPWLCEDSETGDRLLMNNKEVYVPEGLTEQPARHLVLVTIPAFKLEVRCMQILRKYVKSKNDVFGLNIPAALQKKLIEFYLKKDKDSTYVS